MLIAQLTVESEFLTFSDFQNNTVGAKKNEMGLVI